MKRMTVATLVLFLSSAMASCKQRGDSSEVRSAGRRVGSFKDLAAVETTVKSRIVPDSFFSLARFLDHNGEDGLRPLLGGYDGRLGSSSLQNASPNAVNTMLWQIVMEGAATYVASNVCEDTPRQSTLTVTAEDGTPDSSGLERHFQQVAKAICDWPAGGEDHGKTLREFWLDMMRYDAPQAEMEDWVSQVTSADGPISQLKGEALVKDLVQSILMHPFFLLEQ